MKRASRSTAGRAPKPVAQAVPQIAKDEKKPGRFERLAAPQPAAAAGGRCPASLALVFVLAQGPHPPAPVQYTQEDIDARRDEGAREAVPLPSHSTKAYEAVRGSIVRVRGLPGWPGRRRDRRAASAPAW